MGIYSGAGWLMVGLTVVLLGCGGYSASNNPPTSPSDSTRDSMPPPPAYSR
jgi:hypothetical protein